MKENFEPEFRKILLLTKKEKKIQFKREMIGNSDEIIKYINTYQSIFVIHTCIKVYFYK